MTYLTEILFESPWKLGMPAAVVCGTLLVLWRRTGSNGRRTAFLSAVGVSAGLFLLQTLVVTDREAIIALVRDLAEAVESSELDRIEAAIDDSYRAGGLQRQTVMPAIRARLSHYSVERPRLWNFRVEVRGDEATTRFQCLCDVRTEGALVSILSEWSLELVRRQDAWKVRAIEAITINGQRARGLGDFAP